MEYRKFGKTGLELSVLGIGTWAIGAGDWKYSWGGQDDKQSIEAIHAGLAGGMNWIDTAAVYGLGHSEEIVAKAVRSSSIKPIIATKCGLLQNKKGEVYSDISGRSIRKEVEQSLKRLEVEVIDIYQIHWPNPTNDIEEAFQTLLALVQEGKIRYPAVSNFSLDQLKRISEYSLPVSLQSPFNLIRQELSYEVLPWCIENSVAVFAYSPMQCGLLTGKVDAEWVKALPVNDWRKTHKFFTEPLLSQNLLKIEKLKSFLRKTDLNFKNPILAASLQWVINQMGITSAIVGLRNSQQAEEAIQALDPEFSKQDIINIAQCFA